MENNHNLPDFKEMSDRVIADASASPSLVIKTNLDTTDTGQLNPYASKNKESKDFKNFFKE
ncbi:hypothetical protein ACFFIX_09305 [Metabacillus herbersteinensis]|uniref:Uncharacterized protein n=1 Tax=Metabacillus herbersteinensis TaxID=283816 RepID=A0ABV6GDA1_9BACI